ASGSRWGRTGVPRNPVSRRGGAMKGNYPCPYSDCARSRVPFSEERYFKEHLEGCHQDKTYKLMTTSEVAPQEKVATSLPGKHNDALNPRAGAASLTDHATLAASDVVGPDNMATRHS